MVVFLTGATGFVGSAVLQRLLEHNHEVRCLVRPGSSTKLPHMSRSEGRISEVQGDLFMPDSYSAALRGAHAVIHLVGIIREKASQGVTFSRIHVEGTSILVEASKQAGVSRLIHMSALGARPGAESEYHRSKWEAEQRVRTSGLPYIIFRPSVIFGPGDEFVNMLAGLVKAPVTPVFGSGLYRLQPISVHTVAQIFEKALYHEKTGEIYEAGGPEQITYNDLLQQIGRVLNRPVRLLHVPLWLIKPAIARLQHFPLFPITVDQLTMLLEENICHDGNRFVQELDTPQIRFAEGICEYLRAASV